MIYPLLFLLCLASLTEGCAPHSPKRRPPRPQPPVTQPPVIPKTCSQLTVDSSCTDCTPPTNTQKEIKCGTTGKNHLVIVDSGDAKKPVTEAKCDSATGKWAFKNGNDAVNVEPAKVYCSTECDATGKNCEDKPCTAIASKIEACITLLESLQSDCEDPATNDLKEIKCGASGNTALVVGDKAGTLNSLTEAKCDPATGKWAFKNSGAPVEETMPSFVFCTKPCLAAYNCPTCPIIPATDPYPASCGEPNGICRDPKSTSLHIECPSTHIFLKVVDANGMSYPAKQPVTCAGSKFEFKDNLSDMPITEDIVSVYCDNDDS